MMIPSFCRYTIMDSNKDRMSISTRLDRDAVQHLKRIAAQRNLDGDDVNYQDLIRDAVEAYIQGMGGQHE
jgi:hypothetical protein